MVKILRVQALANFRYISPIRFFEHCGINLDEPFQLSRIKKIIQAEFAISLDGFITVDGFEYNKSDLLAFLDDATFHQKIQWHLKIWSNKEILNLLEKEELQLGDAIIQDLDQIAIEPAFLEFFSSYFKTVFNSLCKSVLSPLVMDSLSKLMAFQKYIIPEHQLEAFENVATFLREQDRVLRNTTADNFKASWSEVDFWFAPEWPNFFNQLPEILYDEKETIVVDLINFTVALQTAYRKYTKELSRNLTRLHGIDQDHSALIFSNDRVFNGKVEKESRSYWWLIWIAIWILRALFSDSCN